MEELSLGPPNTNLSCDVKEDLNLVTPAQVIALVKSNPGEQISFEGSMEANFTTEEGGK